MRYPLHMCAHSTAFRWIAFQTFLIFCHLRPRYWRTTDDAVAQMTRESPIVIRLKLKARTFDHSLSLPTFSAIRPHIGHSEATLEASRLL
jgi:hypothetical protein